ncbi:hypothetical protein [Streptomyces sp. NPDC056682]|uniref:hypothetical protein n=1 Tax=Streptomyces sp. NPDC056682 TaxID=3345909 RepID=UPI003688AD05
MASLLVLVAPFLPFATSAEVRAEGVAAMTAVILAEPGHPKESAIPVYRACAREMFESAAAACGFTLDEPVRISCWHRWTARLVFAYRRITRQASLARGGER